MQKISKLALIQVFALALVCSEVAVAAEPVPPPSFPEEITAPPTLRFKPASRLTMGKFVVHFEKTTLSQVIKSVGIGSINHQGDAGGSIYWICYTIPDNIAFQRLWIIADGEMGGTKHKVSGVIATRLSANASTSDGCPNIPKLLQPLSLDQGIWLDSSVSQINKVIGKPSESRDDWRVYYYLGKKSLKHQDPGDQVARIVEFDESSFLALRVEEGKVTTLRATKVTTN